MKKKLTLILICVRNGINPFGRVAKAVDRMRQRLTDEEKERLINLAESETDKKIWHLWLYEKGGAE